MNAVFRAWKQRDLSLAGLAYAARAFATSKIWHWIWYIGYVVPAPLRLPDETNTAPFGDCNITEW